MFGTGWSGFKYGCSQLWHFIEVEIPELISNWRLVPRLMMIAYAVCIYGSHHLVYGIRGS